MALYMYQASYTAESVAAQIKEPQDRIKAVTPAIEALGAKILVGGYPFGANANFTGRSRPACFAARGARPCSANKAREQ